MVGGLPLCLPFAVEGEPPALCSGASGSLQHAGDLGSILGLGRSPGEGNGYPLQYSGLENPMDCIVHGVAKSWTRQSDFHFHCSCLESLMDRGTWWVRVHGVTRVGHDFHFSLLLSD